MPLLGAACAPGPSPDCHPLPQAIVGIHHLPAPVGLLVLVCEDGAALLLDGDSLEGRPLPLR